MRWASTPISLAFNASWGTRVRWEPSWLVPMVPMAAAEANALLRTAVLVARDQSRCGTSKRAKAFAGQDIQGS